MTRHEHIPHHPAERERAVHSTEGFDPARFVQYVVRLGERYGIKVDLISIDTRLNNRTPIFRPLSGQIESLCMDERQITDEYDGALIKQAMSEGRAMHTMGGILSLAKEEARQQGRQRTNVIDHIRAAKRFRKFKIHPNLHGHAKENPPTKTNNEPTSCGLWKLSHQRQLTEHSSIDNQPYHIMHIYRELCMLDFIMSKMNNTLQQVLNGMHPQIFIFLLQLRIYS
ncbi:MAG: hypothetical protein WCO06_04640 [Candidatus Roizmanbacteria bacterium]